MELVIVCSTASTESSVAYLAEHWVCFYGLGSIPIKVFWTTLTNLTNLLSHN